MPERRWVGANRSGREFENWAVLDKTSAERRKGQSDDIQGYAYLDVLTSREGDPEFWNAGEGMLIQTVPNEV
jgi:hypothetical protein